MIHQPLGGFQKQASDIDIHPKETLRTGERVNKILAEHTRQPIERIASNTDRDRFMSGVEAVEYGLLEKYWTAIFCALRHESCHRELGGNNGPGEWTGRSEQ
jgi:ATP-dependent Clp protease protease subunit